MTVEQRPSAAGADRADIGGVEDSTDLTAPLVSIVICVRDDPRLERCLTAIYGEGSEGFVGGFEVIVVENHDAPRLGWLAQDFPIVYSVEAEAGMHRARQTGLAIATGELVVCTDADCVPQRRWLLELTRPLVEDRNVQVVGGRIEKVAPTGWVEELQPDLGGGHAKPQFLPKLGQLPYAVTANAAFRRSRLREVGGLDAQFRSGGDVDLSWRVLARGGTLVIAPLATVQHACRPTVRTVYRQYRTYSSGHALLFRKHRPPGTRYCIDPYPLRLVGRALLGLGASSYRSGGNPRRRTVLRRSLLELVEAVALVDGAVRGSIRHRVFYL